MSLIEQKSYNALAQHYSGDYKKLEAAYIQNEKNGLRLFPLCAYLIPIVSRSGDALLT